MRMQLKGCCRNDFSNSSEKQTSNPGISVLLVGLHKGIALTMESSEVTVRELVMTEERAVWSTAETQRGFHLLDIFLKKVSQYLHKVRESRSLLGITVPAAQHYTVAAKRRCWFYSTEIPSCPTPQLPLTWCPLGQPGAALGSKAWHPQHTSQVALLAGCWFVMHLL